MSTNRPIMAATRGRLFIELHDVLRGKSRPDWFGEDLLKVEQATYHGLVLLGVNDACDQLFGLGQHPVFACQTMAVDERID